MTSGSARNTTAVELEIRAGPAFHAAGRLVAAGLASRHELDVEQIDDLRLALDAALLNEPSEESLTLAMTGHSDALELRIGPFVPGAERKPSRERLLSALVDDVAVSRSGRGEWITVRVLRRPGTRDDRWA